MESSSYPDSGDSSPRSREIDWDEPPPPTAAAAAAAARVKLMISYGGRIQPRPHDNQLSYVGGETKILTIDRSIRFPALLSKLSSLSNIDDHLCFKYQLPGEDLDALISVTNDEDLDHMMLEYDRLHRSTAKPIARLRVFSLVHPKKAHDSSEVRRMIPIDESSNFDAIGFPSLHLRPSPLCCRRRTLLVPHRRCPWLDQCLVPCCPRSPFLTPPLMASSALPTPSSPLLIASSSSSAISAFP